jgi:hypothetical protein
VKPRRQLITFDQAKRAKGQHQTPCSDCPFARTALRGWLGSLTVDEWVLSVHGEDKIECHALLGADCAGAAIYRANVCKTLRDRAALKLPADRVTVFASPVEFAKHHASSASKAQVAAIKRER